MNLSKIMGTHPKVLLLEFFLSRPSSEFYLRELATKTELSVGAVCKHVAELKNTDILLAEKKGRQDFYRLNRQSVTVKTLKRLYTVSSDLIEDAIDTLRRNDVTKIILFGSSARGEDVEKSDVDILVIGDVQPNTIGLAASNLSEKHRRKLSVVVRTAEQYIDMPKREGVLWRRIEQDKVILYEA